MIITCDHGRGDNAETWKDHGQKIPVADQIWFAAMGPDTPATGEMKSESQLYQNQIAKTLAAFLGLDYKGEGKIGDKVAPMLMAK